MATTRSDAESDDDGARRVVGDPPGCAGDRPPVRVDGPHRNVPVDPARVEDGEVQTVIDHYERMLDARRRADDDRDGAADARAAEGAARRRSDRPGRRRRPGGGDGVLATLRGLLGRLF